MTNGISRTEKALKNYLFYIVGNILIYAATFVTKTIFIYNLGINYNGVRGLFTNILGTLSLAELGISTAISFSLYGPLARGEGKKIQALINFYRNAYRIVSIVVLCLGVSIIPFLKFIVNGAEGIDNITLIYCLYLLDSVLSYLFVYKQAVLGADQKTYLITGVYTVTTLIMMAVQCVVVILFKNFILYLSIQIAMNLVAKIIINKYVDKLYPYLKGKNNEKLDPEDRKTIFSKIKALMVYKVGDVAVNQTDNIIMSGFISITAVGICDNFMMIVKIISTVITTVFSSSEAGLGNVFATETEQKKLDIFNKYDFLVFVLFGWSSICLYFLLIPFVTIWLGPDKLVDSLTVLLLCVNFYFTGQRISLTNARVAAGEIEQGAWLSIVEAVINIVASIIGVRLIGLPGIFVGTFISSMVMNISMPIITYKYVFNQSSKSYFAKYVVRIAILLITAGLIALITNVISLENMFLVLIFRSVLCVIVPMTTIWLIFHKSAEWKYFILVIMKLLSRNRKK